ncbi:MAG: UDP-2,3-diacylglucosamine diphosphatase [Bacteroidales bacterium]|nr:UDP-2,3-diacylglucosamine diphosphatase [Bacteroidales bacterium]
MYFISDVHLGLYPPEKSLIRERLLVNWLDGIKADAAELYLLGDIFDFWHEYRYVAPRGFTRFLGKIAELADSGVQLHFFTGNHDIWIYDYLPGEIGLTLYRQPVTRNINGKKFFIGHGDGIGSGDNGYKLMKWGFTNKILQWLFARIHPNASMAFGKRWSKSSRYAKGIIAEPYRGDDQESQVVYARETLQHEHFDYFIFGHRHIPFDVALGTSRVVNLGDWINNFTYAVWDGKELELHSIFPDKEGGIFRS